MSEDVRYSDCTVTIKSGKYEATITLPVPEDYEAQAAYVLAYLGACNEKSRELLAVTMGLQSGDEKFAALRQNVTES